jgi:ABC-type transporter lipoprotein component MlaA
LVLPLLGPSTVRDGAGTAVDFYFDPVGDLRPIRVRNSAAVLRFTGVRADLLDAGRLLEEAALDKYVFLRDAYLQRRRSLVYDGRPPREEREEQDREERRERDAPPQGAPPQDSPPPAEKRGAPEPVNAVAASSVNIFGPTENEQTR